MPRTLLALALISLGACTKSEPPPQAPEAAPEKVEAAPEARDAALKKADAAAMALGRTLKTRVQQELPNGPLVAMKVCADEAQALTAKVAEEQGVKVGRASLRTRNPKNAAPEWVRQWLETQGERKAEGVKGFSRVDHTPQGPMARVVKPIPVESACVLCHGAKESLPPEVTAVLAERYPQDEATGYQVGDLRGALWAETPVAQ